MELQKEKLGKYWSCNIKPLWDVIWNIVLAACVQGKSSDNSVVRWLWLWKQGGGVLGETTPVERSLEELGFLPGNLEAEIDFGLWWSVLGFV